MTAPVGSLDILVILDRSGSMQDAKTDHEGGLRSFVDDQKALPGDVRFTLVQFDSQNPCDVVYDRVPIAAVGPITLVPRGGTPLLDAVGKALAHLEMRRAAEPLEQVLVLVITDGEENESREWTKERVKARVVELEKRNHQFLFLGANVDTFAEAQQLGVSTVASISYAMTPASVGAAYTVTSSNVAGMRASRMSGQSVARSASLLNYTAAQRAAVMPGGTNTVTNDNVADDGHTVTVTTSGTASDKATATQK